MNIGMILDNEFSGDLRVENEVIALSNAGFNVFVLCFNYGNKVNEEEFHNAKIIRFSVSKSTIKKMRALTNTLFDFYTSFWSSKISTFVKNYHIDVLHVHDLYMFGAAFKFRETGNQPIKIVGDLHENYVEGLKHYTFSTTFPGSMLISIKKWERTEVEWINKLDYAITVIDEAVERYSKLGIEEQKFTVVPNYINQDEFIQGELDKEILEGFGNYKCVTYIGAFDLHRGIESIVKAVPKIIKTVKDFKLVLVGDGKNFAALKVLAKELNVSEYIEFEGWQPVGKFPSYIAASTACVIPHRKTVHTDNTIPHKLFQYMIMEKPVIATDCNPIKRIVENENCGVIYKSENSNDFAEKLIALINNPTLMSEMGQRGKSAATEKYNWNAASEMLMELYSKLKAE